MDEPMEKFPAHNFAQIPDRLISSPNLGEQEKAVDQAPASVANRQIEAVIFVKVARDMGSQTDAVVDSSAPAPACVPYFTPGRGEPALGFFVIERATSAWGSG
jgi:hypothetical protein